MTTLNDVLKFIQTEPDWGPNYSNIIVASLKARRKSDALKIKSSVFCFIIIIKQPSLHQ